MPYLSSHVRRLREIKSVREKARHDRFLVERVRDEFTKLLCGADPRDCVVIEDSVAGARAGLAAGCRVLGFAHETPAQNLLEAGVVEVFSDHAALPGLLGIGETERGA